MGSKEPKDNQETKGQKEPFWEKAALAVIVAVLAFVGSFAGTLISSNIEKNAWVRNTTFNYMNTILEKRIDILDRSVRVIATRGQAKIIDESFDLYPTIALLQSDENSSYEFRQEIKDLRMRLDELTAEYASTMSLASLYFGPETNKAVQEIQASSNPDWWNADDEKFRALLAAMNSELGYGFDYVSLKKFAEEMSAP